MCPGLQEELKQAKPFSSLEEEAHLALLRTAASAILLATGEGKRGALVRLLDGDPDLPASALDSLVIVTDLQLQGASR